MFKASFFRPGLKRMASSDTGILFGSTDNLLASPTDSSADPDVTVYVCFPPSDTPVGLTMKATTPKGVPKALITVTDIAASSCSSGLMIEGDTILRVNEIEPDSAKHASELISAARSDGVELKVLRPRRYTVTLTTSPGQGYGISLGWAGVGSPVLVTDLATGSAAIKSNLLCKGCRIVAVDGVAVGAAESARDVACRLHNGSLSVSLTIAHDALEDADALDDAATRV